MPDKDDLDLLIDAALASYGAPSAADPLEDRMLRGVQKPIASPNSRRYLRWLGWSVLAAAACILALILFPTLPSFKKIDQAETHQQPLKTGIAATHQPAPTTGNPIARKATSSVRTLINPPLAVHTAKTDPLPKLDVFPTPVPLDEQVQALAFFVRQAPPNEVKELLEKQAQAEEPLAFKELEIPPLEPLEEGGK